MLNVARIGSNSKTLERRNAQTVAKMASGVKSKTGAITTTQGYEDVEEEEEDEFGSD